MKLTFKIVFLKLNFFYRMEHTPNLTGAIVVVIVW